MLHDLPTFICNLSAMFDNTLHRSRSLRNFLLASVRTLDSIRCYFVGNRIFSLSLISADSQTMEAKNEVKWQAAQAPAVR